MYFLKLTRAGHPGAPFAPSENKALKNKGRIKKYNKE
jgi:hypothetical protein